MFFWYSIKQIANLPCLSFSCLQSRVQEAERCVCNFFLENTTYERASCTFAPPSPFFFLLHNNLMLLSLLSAFSHMALLIFAQGTAQHLYSLLPEHKHLPYLMEYLHTNFFSNPPTSTQSPILAHPHKANCGNSQAPQRACATTRVTVMGHRAATTRRPPGPDNKPNKEKMSNNGVCEG